MKFTTLSSSADAERSAAITPDFSIYTGAMEIDPEQEYVVRMVGSSTERDLQGDTMSISALTDMTVVQPGQVTWLNHNYALPDSLFGSLQKSPSLTLEAGIADIHIVSDVETSNPAALQTYGYLKKGRRLGCSIGCLVTEFEVDEENDDGHGWWPPIIILHVLTLEYSVVGIPANQRCWVEPAAKGLFERMLSEDKGDQALSLAPAVKGLYPRAFQERLKSVDNEALRRDLERIEVRMAPTGRVEWVPNEHVFVMNRKGVYKPVEREEVSTLLVKGIEAPHYAGVAKERTVGTAIPTAKRLPENALRPESVEEKGASGKTSWPLADRKRTWDNAEAHKRIVAWAGGDDPDWGKVKTVHFWFGDEEDEKWGGYKLLFCDVIDGEIKAIPRGIFACVGGHGLAVADIPEEDVPGVKKKIETYYKRMADEFDDEDIVVPWDDEEKAVESGKETAVAVQLANATSQTTTTTQITSIPRAEERYDRANEFLPGAVERIDPLDVQLYNALAAKFGQPLLTLSETGQIISLSALSPEAIQEILLKVLPLIRSGNEFSQENRSALQALHDDLVHMCMSSFHPCKEMSAAAPDTNEDGDEQKSIEHVIIRTISPVQEQVALLTRALSQHALDPKTLKGLQSQAQALQRQFEAIAEQMETTRQDLAKLRSLPLGQPTRLARSVHDDGATASYQDIARLSTTMNDNERRWTLEEALKETLIIVRSLPDGETLNCRKWPEGVGSSVKDGVRPALTGAQRAWMHPMEMIAYNDGGEAAVPCYDDPAGAPA